MEIYLQNEKIKEESYKSTKKKGRDEM